MKKIALVVHTCDRYEFLYTGFAIFFKKFWDYRTNCNYYFATEEKDICLDKFTNIKSGKGSWSDRLRYLLEYEIKEEYILYMQEDMWLSNNTNSNFFNKTFDLFIQNNWKMLKLHSSNTYTTQRTDFFVEGFNIAEICKEKSDYLMSHQITLWNKKFLSEQLHKNEHPWRNERKGTKRLKKSNHKIYQADYFSDNDSETINNNENNVVRSSYKTVSLNGKLNGNIEFFLPLLDTHDKLHNDYKLKLENHYINQLTHDGLKEPRKEDIFKKLKKKLFHFLQIN